MNFERGFYTIEMHPEGKLLHYEGFSSYSGECPDDMDESEWAKLADGSVDFVYPCGVYIPVKDGVDFEELALLTEQHTQYSERVLESEAVGYINEFYEEGTSGTYLPMEKVNADTPCGNYWCYE